MFEAYKIGIRLSLLNGVTGGLLSIFRQFQGLDKQLESTNRKLTETDKLLVGIQRRMIAGGAMMAVGGFGLGAVNKTVQAGREYAHQLALMNVAGMKHLEIVKATQAAWAANKALPTSSTTENLAAIRDLRMVFGDTQHAIEFMPAVQRAQAILQMARHGEGGNNRAEAYEMAKALEMKGAVKSPQQFLAQADLMTKALVATGGKVGASDFLSAFKYGRTATADWNEAFTYSILPTLIQEMKNRGGSGSTGGPGSALMSAYSAVVGGTIPQKSLKVWQKLGMLDPSKIVWTNAGEAKGVRPGGVRGASEFQSNPYQWAQDYLVPALKKAGYKTEEQQKQALQYLFPNRTAGFVMSQFVTQGWKFERDKKLIAQAQGFSAYDKLMKDDPEMAALALQKQWQNLLAILGFQIMPTVLKGMQWLIEKFTALSTWFSRHQTAATALMYSLAGLSAALFVSGAGLTIWGAFSLLGKVLSVTPLGGSLASLLSGAATGFSAVASAAGVLMAAYAGWVAGGLLNDKVINPAVQKITGDKNQTLGGWIYDYLHPTKANGSQSGFAWWKFLPGGFSVLGDAVNYASSGNSSSVAPHSHAIYMDGKKVADAVSNRAGRAMNSGMTSNGGVDVSMIRPQPAMSAPR